MDKRRVIAIEEHYWTPELRETLRGIDVVHNLEWARRLSDLGELRIKEMDEAGIELQVISHREPATQKLDAQVAVPLARRANDALYAAVCEHPDRFAGFAALPTPDPGAAAAELERAVTKLGFKGAMIHGLTNGSFIDERRFWVIFERAQALDVPIYLHPATPHPAVLDAYFKNMPATVARAGWGFTMETATQAIRLIVSGVFDHYPTLKIILGHLGESVPFSLGRCDEIISRDSSLKRRFRDYFVEHFYITTSGNFSFPALRCCLMEMGADRVIFAVDWPMASNVAARQFIETAPISAADKEKIFHANVESLLKL